MLLCNQRGIRGSQGEGRRHPWQRATPSMGKPAKARRPQPGQTGAASIAKYFAREIPVETLIAGTVLLADTVKEYNNGNQLMKYVLLHQSTNSTPYPTRALVHRRCNKQWDSKHCTERARWLCFVGTARPLALLWVSTPKCGGLTHAQKRQVQERILDISHVSKQKLVGGSSMQERKQSHAAHSASTEGW